MEEPLNLSELELLKLENAQLKWQLSIQQLQLESQKQTQIRDTIFRTILSSYVSSEYSLKDFKIDFENKTVCLIKQEDNTICQQT